MTEHGVWARPPAAAAVGCLGEELVAAPALTARHWLPRLAVPPPVISSGVLPPAVLAWASVEERGVRPEWYGADCASGPSPLSR